MRTIKFRIWNGEDGYCTEGFVKANLFNIIDSQPEYVQQFTGLLDKFGKEIYEGDIVNEWKDDKYKVYYDKYTSSFRLKGIDSTRNHGMSELSATVSYGIIGNIYENKELLN